MIFCELFENILFCVVPLKCECTMECITALSIEINFLAATIYTEVIVLQLQKVSGFCFYTVVVYQMILYTTRRFCHF